MTAIPTISVVIPTFNREQFIGEAIQSALNQTCLPLEIIVIDDGSTDRTEQVVRGFSSPIPIRYHWQQNQWQASALNQGVSMARGDWVAFLDSDDVWYPHKLAVQVAAIEAHPKIPFFYAKMDYFDTDEAGHVRWVERKSRPVLEPLMFHGLPNIHVPTVVMRKDVFVKAGGFNPSLRIGESWEFFTRLALTHPIHCVDQSLAKQRYHPNQITRELRVTADHFHRFHARMWDIWRNDPKKHAILNRYSGKVYAELGRYFLGTRDYDRARECYRRSLSYHPWSLKSLRRWVISNLPGIRDRYSQHLRPVGDSRDKKSSESPTASQ